MELYASYIGLATIVYVSVQDITRRVGILFKRELANKHALIQDYDFSKIEQLLVVSNRSISNQHKDLICQI